MIEEEVVGFIYGYTLKRLNSNPMLYIHSIDVKESYRKQGIGKELLIYTLEYAKRNNYRSAFLITNKSNYAACKLYDSVNGLSNNDDDIVYSWKM